MAILPLLEVAPRHAMVPLPSMVAYAQMLALPTPELDAAIAYELDRNPALVADDWPQSTSPSTRGPDAKRAAQPPAERASEAPWRDALLRDLRLELDSLLSWVRCDSTPEDEHDAAQTRGPTARPVRVERSAHSALR